MVAHLGTGDTAREDTASSFVKGILWIVIIVFIVLLMFPCLVKCLQKSIGEVFIVRKNRGVVESLEPLGGIPRVLPWKDLP